MRASRNQQKLNKLHECVGDEKFTELLNMFSGDIISRNAQLQEEYDKMIHQGIRSGEAVEMLSMWYELSKSTIYAAIKVYEL